MTAEARHHVAGSLWLAVALAATAGFVDAFVYVRVTPVFVANMSGNLIRLGIATGQWRTGNIAASGMALSGFLVGVVAATSHLDGQLRDGKTVHPLRLLLGESGLVLGVAAILLIGHIGYSATVLPRDYVVIVIGAAAMGLQSVALRRVGQVAVSTTYGTGSVVRLGEKLALGLRGTDRPSDQRRRVTIVVLASVLCGYVAGAALGAAIGASPYLLLVPAAIPVVAVAAVVALGARPER